MDSIDLDPQSILGTGLTITRSGTDLRWISAWCLPIACQPQYVSGRFHHTDNGRGIEVYM